MYTRQTLEGFIDYLEQEERTAEAIALQRIFVSAGDVQMFTAGQIANVLEDTGFEDLSEELGEKWLQFYDPAA